MLKLFRMNYLIKNVRSYTSALYITGDKAQSNFAFINPHLDIVERLNKPEILKHNLEVRHSTIDLDKLTNHWAFYLDLLQKKQVLKYTKSEIGKELSKLMTDHDNNVDEINKLKAHMNIVKDEFSVLKQYFYGVEETAAFYALSLPNILHERTPIDVENQIFASTNKMPDRKIKSHVEIGLDKKLLEFFDNSVFLLNEAAHFEHAIINYFQNCLLQEKFDIFSNSDFTKSLIVEGCGVDFSDKFEVITLDDDIHSINRLHLTGGASHFAFMAYFAKFMVLGNKFPLKYFSIGRKYQPVKTDELSLFNLNQNSCIEIFIATTDCLNEQDVCFNQILMVVKQIYESLGFNFQLVLLPAQDLKSYESLHLSIQMFSNYLKKYIEVGNISICDNYLSKRLLFTYQEEKEQKFPKVITGNILNVHKLLACCIENNPENLIPELLQNNLTI